MYVHYCRPSLFLDCLADRGRKHMHIHTLAHLSVYLCMCCMWVVFVVLGVFGSGDLTWLHTCQACALPLSCAPSTCIRCAWKHCEWLNWKMFITVRDTLPLILPVLMHTCPVVLATFWEGSGRPLSWVPFVVLSWLLWNCEFIQSLMVIFEEDPGVSWRRSGEKVKGAHFHEPAFHWMALGSSVHCISGVTSLKHLKQERGLQNCFRKGRE